jgi:hypothetical protein
MLIGALVALALSMSTAGCGDQSDDIAKARKFDRFPLYWVGERFERWELTHIDGLDYRSPIIGFMYGKCTPHDGEQPSCTPPFQIQVSAFCDGAPNIGNGRRVRGAPVGAIGGAPVLFTRGAQIKVYRGEGSYRGLEMKVLRSLRSINRVPPVVTSTARFPRPSGTCPG